MSETYADSGRGAMRKGGALPGHVRDAIAVVALALLALLLRLPIALSAPRIIDADEAMNALEAMHIAQGRSLPVTFYGTDYLGVAELYVVAGLFRLFGVHGVLARVPSLALSCLLVVAVTLTARRWMGGTAGLVAGGWIAAAPLALLVWGGKACTGYLPALLFGTLILAAVHRIGWDDPPPRRPALAMALLGLLCGLGIWCHPIIAPYVAVTAVTAAIRRSRFLRPAPLPAMAAALGGLIAGAAPVVAHNVATGGGTVRFLLGGGSAATSSFFRAASRAFNLATSVLPAVFGGGMSWSYRRPQQSVVLPPGIEQGAWLVMVAALMAALALIHRRRSSRWRTLPLLSAGGAVLCAMTAILFVTRRSAGAAGPVAVETAILSDLANPWLLVWILLAVPLAISAVTPARPGVAGLAWGVIAATLGLYLLTRFGDMRSPRFVFPLYTALPILLAHAVTCARGARRAAAIACVTASIGLNLTLAATVPGDVLQQPEHYVPAHMLPSDSDDLIRHLESTGAVRVWAKYWLGTPLIFQSRERIVTSNGRTGRYEPYDAAVRDARAGIWLFYRGSPEQIDLERVMRQRGVACARADLSVYTIYRGCGAGLEDALAAYLAAP